MSVAGGVGAAGAIDALAGIASEVIEGGFRLLMTPITLELGSQGYKVGGRRRSRKTKDGQARFYDDRIIVTKITVPIAVPMVLAWWAGLWTPGELVGKLLTAVFGANPGISAKDIPTWVKNASWFRDPVFKALWTTFEG